MLTLEQLFSLVQKPTQTFAVWGLSVPLKSGITYILPLFIVTEVILGFSGAVALSGLLLCGCQVFLKMGITFKEDRQIE